MAIAHRFVPVRTLIFWDGIILAPVHVARPPCSKEHLYPDDDEHRCHSDKACHGRIAIVPESRKAWICERDERGGEKMHKCRCDENTGAKMAREEEEVMGNRKAGEPADYNRK